MNAVKRRNVDDEGAVWPDGFVIFQSLAIYNNDNMRSSIKIAKVGTKFCQILNKPYQNLTKDL